MRNLTGSAIGFPTFIGVIHKAMLTVTGSGEGYMDGKVYYDCEKRTLDVSGTDFLDFQSYMEALAADGIPGTEPNAEGVTVVSATNERELTGFLQEVVRKMESPLIVGRRYGTEFSIRLVAERMVVVKFALCGETDTDAPLGFSTLLTLPL